LIKIAQKFIFPDKAMFWYPNVKTFLFQNKQIIENTDIVFSTSPGVTNHQIARLIKRKNSKVKWIADFRDFNFVDVWEHEQGIKALRHKKLEASIISESTYLTFVTKTMQLNYQKFYLKHKDKMHCVFNGFDLMDFSQFEEKVIDTKKITIFYAGSFYGGIRSPFPLMELIEKALINEVINKNDIEVLIAGSIEDTMIAELKKLSSFDCIKFLGSIPRTNVIEYMSNSTFLWLIVGNLKSHYQTIPIKLFEYIASRRPIINFAPNISECTSIIYEKKLGYSFNTLDFNLEDSYKDFEKLIKSAKIGEFSQSLSTENVNYFLWDKQIKSIEKLF
jgi:glycosyltransferase involved in cell wall biosynthesis